MNCLIESLARVCREHVLEEKWLVAPSRRTGYQWLDAMARAGQPSLNVRVTTIKRVALGLAARWIADCNVTLINPEASAIVLEALCRAGVQGETGRAPALDGGYLSALDTGPALAQALHAALESLRLAGLDARDLRPAAFDVQGKGRDLARLLEAYRRRLEELQLVDYAGVLEWAILRLAEADALGPGVLVLLPEDLDLQALERRLVEAMPQGQLRRLPVDRAGVTVHGAESEGDRSMFSANVLAAETGNLAEKWTSPRPPRERLHAGQLPADGERSDSLLLRWLPNPAEAPLPQQDGTGAIFRAVGEANEVREVLRRVLAGGRRLDEVEVLHTDAEVYIPLFYELAWRLQPEGDGADRSLPLTFAEGIPVRYSRPGRALGAWLAWIDEDYPQAVLARMIQDGLVELAGRDRGQSFSGLAEVFRGIPIGFGRQRYLDEIARQKAACRGPIGEEGEDEDRARPGDDPARRTRLELLGQFLADLLAISPDRDAGPKGILTGAEQFLRRFARSANELDSYAQVALVEEIATLGGWLARVEGAGGDCWEWLRLLPGRTRVGGSGPRPGCLHVADVHSGGHSGRPVTFILGLDDGRFPGAGLQDPLLLDHERRELSDQLSTAAGQLKDRLEDFSELLARLRGQVTLSYSCHGLADDREMFPSPAILGAYRILSGRREGDVSDLLAWLPPPASFAPRSEAGCLDACEWWLWRLCGPQSIDRPLRLLRAHFPHLARGRRAAVRRAGARLTFFDGLVREGALNFDPGAGRLAVFSASGLELLGRCPLAWFFRYRLGLESPQELAVDPDQWLTPMESGSLLHDLYRRFLNAIGLERSPKRTEDEPLMLELLAAEIDRWRLIKPPPSSSVFRAERRRLEEAARVFLASEEEESGRSRPLFLEASLGMVPIDEPTPLDDPRPIEIPLPSGRIFAARGRIDRVDRLGPPGSHRYAVWDYKTGGPAKYADAGNARSGRLVQGTLYQAMVERALQRIDPEALVAQFGYYFPTARGQGERLSRGRDELAADLPVIDRLCQIAAEGAFLATNEIHDCQYCDYRPVCRNVERTVAASNKKLGRAANLALAAMRALRG